MMNGNCQAAGVKTIKENANVMRQVNQADETIVMVITGGKVVRFEHITGSYKLQGLDGEGI